MLSTLISRPLGLLTLGAQAHNRLNAVMIDEIVATMSRHDWTCHKCGTRLPGMMEVDHVKGHKVSAKDALLPICQFCHDREHLVWAAARKRVVLIHAPDLSHEEISQLAWAHAGHTGREGFSIDRRKLARDLGARREDAYDALGHDNLEAVFEAIFGLRDARGAEAAEALTAEIDAHLRVAPASLLEDEPEIDTWTRGGFRDVAPEWRDAVIPSAFPGYETLKAAGTSLKARL